MAASTITRSTWVDGAGTGTVINNARLQGDVYDKVDQMFSGAGAYATLTLGGVLTVEGFGSHFFSAGGVGTNTLRVRNTTAGTGNAGQIQVGQDTIGDLLAIFSLSSTFVSGGDARQSGALIRSGGSGGLDLSSTNGTTRMHSTGGFGGTDSGQTFEVMVNGVLVRDAAAAFLCLSDSGAALDEKVWAITSNDGILSLATLTDAFGSGVNALTIDRAGTAISNATLSTDLLPSVDNTHDLGSTSLRWAIIRGVTIQSGDYQLENGWAFTESYKVGINEPGIAVLDQDGDVMMFIGRGGMCSPPEGWRRTTAEERARWA